MSETLDVDRLADVVTELTNTLSRLSTTLDRLEAAQQAITVHVEGHVDPAIVSKLTDERFRTVTR